MEIQELEQKFRKTWRQRKNPKRAMSKITRLSATVRLSKTSLEFALQPERGKEEKEVRKNLYLTVRSTKTAGDFRNIKGLLFDEQGRIKELFEKLRKRYKTIVPSFDNLDQSYVSEVWSSANILLQHDTSFMNLIIKLVKTVKRESSDRQIDAANISFTEEIEYKYDSAFS